MDWFDLLEVQGTLESLLQHRSSKAPMLRCSVFFMVQLSHPPDLILVEADGRCPCVVDNVDLYWGQASQATQGTLAWGNKVTTREGQPCATCARDSENHTAACRGRPRWTPQAEEAGCGYQPAGGAEPAGAGESGGDEALPSDQSTAKGWNENSHEFQGGEETAWNPEATSPISCSQTRLRGYTLRTKDLHPPETANGLDVRAESALSQKWCLINFCLLRKAKLTKNLN